MRRAEVSPSSVVKFVRHLFKWMQSGENVTHFNPEEYGYCFSYNE